MNITARNPAVGGGGPGIGIPVAVSDGGTGTTDNGREYNVKVHDVVGDGVTDDTTALQALFDLVKAAGGGIIYFPPGTYILNTHILLTSPEGITITGVAGKSIIKTTNTGITGSRIGYFYFIGAPKNILIENLTFDDSSIVDAYVGGASYIGNISIHNPDDLTIRNCHFIETVSCGININSGRRILIEGITANGVRGYSLGSSPPAIDGNFINVNGAYNLADDKGGNIVTHCRLGAYSSLSAYHFMEDTGSYANIWHDSNCAVCVQPLGTVSEYSSPDVIVSTNFITNFQYGMYTEGPAGGSYHSGRVAFQNNYFRDCIYGMSNSANATNAGSEILISDNVFHNIGYSAISCIQDKIINISGNLFYNWGIHGGVGELAGAVGIVSVNVDISNINISNNLGVVDTRYTSGGITLNRVAAIGVYASAGDTIKNVTVSGNQFTLGGDATDVLAGNGLDFAFRFIGNIANITVTGNMIHNCSEPAMGFKPLWGETAGPHNVAISGNLIDDVNIDPTNDDAIVISGDAAYFSITGNVVRNSAGNTENFINTLNTVDYVNCINNRLIGLSAFFDWDSSGVHYSSGEELIGNIYDLGSVSTNQTLYWDEYNYVTLILTGNIAISLPVLGHAPRDLYIEIAQDATGNRTATFVSADMVSAGAASPLLTGTANSKDILHFYWDGNKYVYLGSNANLGIFSYMTHANLIGSWELEGNANDTSGNSKNGVVDGAVYVTGKYGQGMDFDGVNDKIDIDGTFVVDTSGPFTICCWINPDEYGTYLAHDQFFGAVKVKTDQATGFCIFASNVAPDYAGITFGSSANFLSAHTVTNISSALIGTWTHVCVTYNGSGRSTIGNYKLYINGVDTPITAASSFLSTDNNTQIGKVRLDDYYWADGKIDNVHVFNVELSSANVNRVMSGIAPE